VDLIPPIMELAIDFLVGRILICWNYIGSGIRPSMTTVPSISRRSMYG